MQSLKLREMVNKIIKEEIGNVKSTPVVKKGELVKVFETSTGAPLKTYSVKALTDSAKDRFEDTFSFKFYHPIEKKTHNAFWDKAENHWYSGV